MKTMTFKNNWITGAAVLLILPTAFFILVGILSEFGINGPMMAAQPVAEALGIKEPPGGFNISTLILIGPMLAILLTVFQFLKIEWHFSKEESFLHFTFKKKWFPIMVTMVSGVLLTFLFFYMLGENCNC